MPDDHEERLTLLERAQLLHRVRCSDGQPSLSRGPAGRCCVWSLFGCFPPFHGVAIGVGVAHPALPERAPLYDGGENT